MSQQLAEIMTVDPVFAHPDTPIQQVAQIMIDCACGEVPICDQDGALVGVITDRDIAVRVVGEGRPPEQTSAGDVMTRRLVAARFDDSVDQAIRMMEFHQIRRLPVIDEERRLLGIVSQVDIAARSSTRKAGELLARHARLNKQH